MNVQMHAKNMTLSNRLQEYAERKVARLDRYLPDIDNILLEFAEERHRNGGDRVVVQLTVRHSRGTILRAEDRSQSDPFAGVDLVVDKLYRQISRYKGKRRRRAGDRWEALEPELAAAEPLPIDEEEDYPAADILRRKQIEMRPMSEEEAIEQMELLGHDFFLFYNVGARAVSVVYRRKEGGYGILEAVSA